MRFTKILLALTLCFLTGGNALAGGEKPFSCIIAHPRSQLEIAKKIAEKRAPLTEGDLRADYFEVRFKSGIEVFQYKNGKMAQHLGAMSQDDFIATFEGLEEEREKYTHRKQMFGVDGVIKPKWGPALMLMYYVTGAKERDDNREQKLTLLHLISLCDYYQYQWESREVLQQGFVFSDATEEEFFKLFNDFHETMLAEEKLCDVATKDSLQKEDVSVSEKSEKVWAGHFQ